MSRHGDRRRVARYVAARRGALGLTQEQLASAAEVDPKTVWSLESAERWPIAKNRSKIERALNWNDGDIAVVAEGGFPASGPLDADDPDGLIAAAGTDDFDDQARAVIADLPEQYRDFVEEIYEQLLDARRQNRRLQTKIVPLPSPRTEGDDGDGPSRAMP